MSEHVVLDQFAELSESAYKERGYGASRQQAAGYDNGTGALTPEG